MREECGRSAGGGKSGARMVKRKDARGSKESRRRKTKGERGRREVKEESDVV